ncbi:MAG TPA: CheR family methyltransferase [Blastocatellia bacterium]|nr:CheR family methyltransferase [Blastocatellia bacterium]
MAWITGHDSGHLHDCKEGAGLGLSDCEFQSLGGLIERECGFYLGAEKRTFLESRLRKRMDELGLKAAHDYYCLLRDDRERDRELPTLLDRLMICETSFFRNITQFELLTEVVLPDLITGKERTGSQLIRVWSAGCATGQEPYSLAICLNEALAGRGAWTIRVLASDLSFTALEKAQSGHYRRDQLGGISPEYFKSYFTEEGGSYRINDFVRREVIFSYHNLKHDNGMRGLDAIFCRNVLIYFGVEEQRRVIDRLTRCLAPGGYLFLGHAESLQGLSSRFTMVHRNKGIAYRLDG